MDDARLIVDDEGNEVTVMAVRRANRIKTLPDGTTEELPGFIAHFVDAEGKTYFPAGPTSMSDGEKEYTVKTL